MFSPLVFRAILLLCCLLRGGIRHAAAADRPNLLWFVVDDMSADFSCCGEAADRIRSVRTATHLYIRNFHPQRPHLMPNDYKDSKVIIQRLRELEAAGALSRLSQDLLFAPVRPSEELYEWTRDRWQTVNLATDPAAAGTVKELSRMLDEWISESGDPGDESPGVYDQEIADELAVIKSGTPRYATFSTNAEIYRRWIREGK